MVWNYVPPNYFSFTHRQGISSHWESLRDRRQDELTSQLSHVAPSWTHRHAGGNPSELHDPPQTQEPPTSPHQANGCPCQTCEGPGGGRAGPGGRRPRSRRGNTEDTPRGDVACAAASPPPHGRHPAACLDLEAGSASTLPADVRAFGLRLQLPLKQLRGVCGCR